MDQPTVKVGDCIDVGDTRCAVLRIANNGEVYVGYYDYPGLGKNKPWNPIKREVTWNDNRWTFVHPDPNGLHINDAPEEDMIRRCHE